MAVQPEVVLGDITRLEVDVIVNAANPSLLGGGGVDGAIHRAAGPELLAACKVVRQQQGECPPGHAVITAAGNLPASAVIHAVGPVWHGGDRQEAELLADVYEIACCWPRQIITDPSHFLLSAPAYMVTLNRPPRR